MMLNLISCFDAYVILRPTISYFILSVVLTELMNTYIWKYGFTLYKQKLSYVLIGKSFSKVYIFEGPMSSRPEVHSDICCRFDKGAAEAK